MRTTSLNHLIVIASYVGLIILQILWHMILPPPHGSRLVWLGIILGLFLLLPLKGILQGSIRSMTWGGYLLMLYFSIGVMEAWSNPDQRIAAVVQLLLVLTCFVAIFRFSRETP